MRCYLTMLTRFALLGCVAGGMALPSSAADRVWSGEAAWLRQHSLAAYDLCVIRPDDRLQKAWKRPGQTWLARIDPSTQVALSDGSVPIIAGLPGKSVSHFDTASAQWPAFAVKQLLVPLLERGFDGWVLEGAASERLLRELHDVCPKQTVLLAGTSFIEGDLDAVQSKTPTVAVCFADALTDAHEAWLARCEKAGISAFITPREGKGRSLAPLREQSRRVLVLYGWDEVESGKTRMVPADTMCAQLLQMPLEWMGYECAYHSVLGELPADPASYAAVILDGDTQVPTRDELTVAQWLVRAKATRVPICFFGNIPFTTEEALDVLRAQFGLQGSMRVESKVTAPTIAIASTKHLGFETKTAARVQGFRDLQAPADAELLLSLVAKGTDGRELRFVPIFTAPWGLVWLEPYVVLRASPDSNLFHADPFVMMAALLHGQPSFPAPDTTTRAGRRLFYSHIDGDGFVSRSSVRGHPLCAEVVRDQVLKTYPLPVTVSVIEAEMRGWVDKQPDDAAPYAQQVARSILSMPNVQPASHSFSHPYQWHESDPDPGDYSEPNLVLKAIAEYPHIVAEREIAGSIDFINRELCPPDKPVELMLWSGNCRPGAEALRVCERIGVEAMNGGDTIVSKLYPGHAGVAPRCTQWDGELQVFAANQNEFMYASGWTGPFYSGFGRVTQTFERTEEGRRVKPVNIYYHFYSAMNLSSLRALKSIYDWCQQHDLHPVTAKTFAQLTRDAWRTRVYALGQRHWLLASDGHVQSFRYAKTLGLPSIKQSKGVQGYIEHQDSIYVHTSDAGRVELVLRDADQAEAGAYLRSSTEALRSTLHTTKRFAALVTGWRPAHIEIAGWPARADLVLKIDDAPKVVVADAAGVLSFTAPARCSVDLFDPSEPHVSLHP